MEDQIEMDAKTSASPHNDAGPGAMLQIAREGKKLSQADVAKKLRLSLQWVRDIENDDYAHGAALIYVRGYLRSYARLVEISPHDVIGAFETMDLEEEFKRAKSNEEKVVLNPTVPVLAKQTRLSSRRIVRWVSGIAILILVVLVAIWWQGQHKHVLQLSLQPLQPVQTVAQPQTKATNQVTLSPPAQQ